MDLSAFARMLARRAWLPVAGGLAGALLGLAVALLQSPGYEGLTRLRLELAKPADYGQTQATKELMASVVEDIKTHGMAEATAARLYDTQGADWMLAHGVSTDTLHGMLYAGKLGVTADANVYEIQVKARADSPEVAEAISLRWAETFVDRRAKANLQRDRDERVEAVLRDDTSHSQYKPRRKLLLAAGGLAGLAAGAALMLLAEFLESAVLRDARDAQRASGLPLLGSVPPRPGARRGPGAIRRGLAGLAGSAGALARLALPVLLFALLGAAAAYAFSQAQPTVYRGRARIALEPAVTSNWGNAQAIRETMRGFKEDIRTARMARRVIDALELDLPEQRLLEPKRLNVAEDTSIYEIRIDVFDSDPEMVRQVSREWAMQFIEDHRASDLQRDQRDRIEVRLRDDAITAEPWSPKVGINTGAGAILGALVGAAALWLLQLLRGGLIEGPTAAERAAGAPVLAVVPPREGT